MKKRLAILFLMTVILGFRQAAAQTVHVTGNVEDAVTNEKMPWVNVALMRPTDTTFVRGATTDAEGNFDISGVESGTYLLRASFMGHNTLWQNVVIDAGNLSSTLLGTLRLAPGQLLNKVVVSAAKPIYAMDGEKNMYNTKEDPSIQTGTASDALQNAPGVEVDAEGNITLRGVSSVEIWINDRPSHMNEEALKQYIKQLPANAIERIEVITNPSARYSTKGGVINIVTNQSVTRNELLCLGLRARTSPNLSPWLSYVWANEKVDFNLYVNADWAKHHTYTDGQSTLFNPTTGDTSRYQSNRDTTVSNNFGGYTGVNINWNISERTHLSSWAGFYPYWGSSSSTRDLDYREYSPLRDLGYRYTFDNDDGKFWGAYAGVWLEHRFDTTGRKVSLSVNGNTWNNDGTSFSTFAYHNPLRDTLRRRNYTDNGEPSIGIEVDYAHPFKNNWELDAGLETSLGGSPDSDILDTMADGQYVNVPLRSYHASDKGIDFDLYATLQKRWGGLTVKAGLRTEWMWLNGNWHYGDGSGTCSLDTTLFAPVPSIHISYQTENFTSYSLSYTRRYSNASREQFSTFVRYDDYSYTVGNPNLRICYTHNLEAAFNKYVVGFGNISLGAYLRANTDEIGTMAYAGYAPDYFPPTQLVNYTRPENIGSSHTEGLEANITYRPSGFVNIRLNASVFNYAYSYGGFSDSRVSWSARLNVWTKLWSRLEVFANAHYSSPRLGLYSMSVANKGVDFGVSSDFFDRKLSLFLNVNDIFGMAEWGNNTTAPQYQTSGSSRYDSRFVSLGVTWRIGKMELESKARQGATESPRN